MADATNDNQTDPFTGEPISKSEVDEVNVRTTMAAAVEIARRHKDDRGAQMLVDTIGGGDVRLLARACLELAAGNDRLRATIAKAVEALQARPAVPPPDAIVDVAVSAAATEAVQLARALRFLLPFAEDRGLARLEGISREDAVAMGLRALGDQRDH